MAEQAPPSLSPPSDLRWPPENPGTGSARGRKMSRWGKWLSVVGVVAIAVALAGTLIRLPYDTLAPGGTLNLETRVSVKGTKTYPTKGKVMLLFVRERAHINLWSWLQAKIDPDIDLVKQVDVTGGNSQQEADRQDVCDMSQSQTSARVAAVSALGYHVSVLPGVVVADLPAGFPAVKVLQPCDEIVAADGRVLKQAEDLSKIVKSHRVGSTVALRVMRAGKTQTVAVPVVSAGNRHVIGVGTGAPLRRPSGHPARHQRRQRAVGRAWPWRWRSSTG